MIARWFAVLVCFAGQSFANDTLHLYNWNNYLAPQTVKHFEAECGCKVIQDYYASMGEMQAKLDAKVKRYDVLVPSAYVIGDLIDAGYLQPLDKKQLPQWRNLHSSWLNPEYDVGNRYTVPYSYTQTVIGYNEAKLKEAGIEVAPSWAMVFEPERLAPLKGRVSVLDDPREVFAAALRYLGYSANDTSEAHWREAQRVILKALPYWAGFDASNYISRLASGRIWLVLGYSNDIVQAGLKAGEGHHVRALVPREGANQSLDSMVIMSNAPRPDLAHRFINFILEGRNSAELTNLAGASNPNAAAMPFVDKGLARDPAVFPDSATSAKLEGLKPLDARTGRLMARLWAEIRAR